MNQNEVEALLKRSVYSILSTLELSQADILELLEISEKEFSRISHGSCFFRVRSLEYLCSKLNLSLDHLYFGNIDYEVLVKQYRKDKLVLPEKYRDPNLKLARARTVLGIHNYLQTSFGPNYVRSLFRKLQIHPIAFSDPDELVSPFLVQDLLSEVSKSRFSENALVEMGRNAITINMATAVGKLLYPSRTPKDLYEKVHGEILNRHYDKIFEYQLLVAKPNKIVMATSVKEDAQSLLGMEVFGDRQLCLYKQGVYSSFLGHINNSSFGTMNKSKFKLLESECLYLGDRRCVFHLSV